MTPADRIMIENESRSRRQGRRRSAWTVDGAAALARTVALGVDAIITDTPAVLRAVLRDG